MGEIIRAGASRDDTFTDGRVTLERARAKGDPWREPAETRLVDTLGIIAAVQTERAALEATVLPLTAALAAREGEADLEIVQTVEDLFNQGGRRRNDPWLTLLAPGGAGGWADGPVDEQPTRMALFANLLRQLGHKRIPKAETDAAALRIDAAAKPLSDAVEAAREPRTRLAQLDRTLTALARTLRLELVALKLQWKAAGYSETEIHSVIPDRPSQRQPAPTDALPPVN